MRMRMQHAAGPFPAGLWMRPRGLLMGSQPGLPAPEKQLVMAVQSVPSLYSVMMFGPSTGHSGMFSSGKALHACKHDAFILVSAMCAVGGASRVGGSPTSEAESGATQACGTGHYIAKIR